MFFVILVLVFGLDQYTKFLVSSNMQVNETITLFKGIFDITYIRNKGAAFGIFYGKQAFLSVVTILLLVGLCIFVFLQRKKLNLLEMISLALIAGGGFGNLYSRLTVNYVVDFFNFYFWPVFNVADIAICVGCGLLMLSVFILEPAAEKKKKNE